MKKNQNCENSFFSKTKIITSTGNVWKPVSYFNRGGEKQKETSSSSSLSLSTIVIPFFLL